jgi:hypothetical protein
MSFTASWPIYDDSPDGGRRMTVTTPDEADTLVRMLAEDTAGAATIEHHNREQSVFMGEPSPDHVLSAGVWQGFGYLQYVDTDHELAHPLGDPNSPIYHSDSSEFDAGTGVPIETLAKALKEFLATAQRPTCVEWRAT